MRTATPRTCPRRMIGVGVESNCTRIYASHCRCSRASKSSGLPGSLCSLPCLICRILPHRDTRYLVRLDGPKDIRCLALGYAWATSCPCEFLCFSSVTKSISPHVLTLLPKSEESNVDESIDRGIGNRRRHLPRDTALRQTRQITRYVIAIT